jgi:hypothetical protein
MTRARDIADQQDNLGGAVAPFVAGKNAIINGGFDIWQRGTSIALTTTTYTADRWNGYRSAVGSTVSRQVTGDTTNLPFVQYCARTQRDSGNTSTVKLYFGTTLESVNSIPFAGKSVTFSFYARAGANFSAASSALVLSFATGTNTDVNYVTGSSAGWTTTTQTYTLTTTWQRFTYTATIPSTAVQIASQFDYSPVGTAGAADYFDVTGVQLEVGSVATPFSRNGGTISGELAACQRYYFRATASAVYSSLTLTGQGNTTSIADCMFPVPVTMRTYPTGVDYANVALSDEVAGVYSGGTLLISGSVYSNQYIPIRYTHTSAALTTYRVYKIIANNNSSAYVGVSAEL